MQLKRDTIVMPVETTARELTPKLYLAIKLAEKGFVSYLGLKSMTHEVAARSGKAIYLDKGYHPGVSDEQYEKLRAAGALVVGLDEENGVDFKDFHMLNVRMPDKLFSLVDHLMIWGQAQYDHLHNNRSAFDPDKISITGHPRFDLVKPEFRGLYAAEVERLKLEYGDFVLVNTNTKFGNNMNGREFIITNYLSRVKGLMERLEYDDKRLEANLGLVRKIVAETPYTVVVRPHPEENIDTYREALGDLPRVRVVYEGAPMHWLLAAEHIIHNHSTTGLEAAMLGKTPICYSPVEVDLEFVPWIPIACSLSVSTDEGVLELLAKEKANWPEPPNVGQILQDFFSYDRCAVDLVVETLERIAVRGPAPAGRGDLAPYLAKLKVKGVIDRLRGGATMSDLARKKLNDLKPAVVRRRFDELLGQGITACPVLLESLHPYLYRVAPR